MVSFSSLLVACLTAGSVLAVPTKAPLAKRSNIKKGIAYNDATKVGLFSDETWAYNWDKSVNGNLPAHVEYVPMLWGSKTVDGWDAAVEKALSSGSKHILDFNEPNNQGQVNLNPSAAVSLYKQYITKYGNHAELVTPAVTNGDG